MMRHLMIATFRTLFLFGLIGFTYIALIALVHPETLPLQLTHFAMWPREDTFGAICFAVSFFSYFMLNVLKQEK